jgi:DnaK suppressor protein
MVERVKQKKSMARAAKPSGKDDVKSPAAVAKDDVADETAESGQVKARSAKMSPERAKRYESLHRMLTAKRQEILNQIRDSLGQSLTEDQRRRLESAMDVGDQSLMDLERELGISLLEMRNRKRQMIDEALIRLEEGLYGICAECGTEISERRLEAVPFAKLCVECQAQQELLEKIEKTEERD